MLKIDFHSPAKADVLGYGRFYQSFRAELIRQSRAPDNHSFSVTEPYAGGDVQIHVGMPFLRFKEYYKRKSDRFLIFTMWESTKIPQEWIPILDGFDEIITPCKWCEKIFRNAGFEKPIHIVPLGVAPEKFPLLERKRTDNEPFTFLWQGTFLGDRKGGKMVEAAFKELGLKNSKLILKSHPGYLKKFAEWDIVYHDSQIRSIGKVLSHQELLEIIGQADVSVYPSRGEGFGLIPLEHMATGLLTILSDNTGMSQFCNTEYNLPLMCNDVCSSYGLELGSDYLPDENQLKGMMAWAYNNKEEAKKMGIRASRWVYENWTWEKSVNRFLEVLDVKHER